MKCGGEPCFHCWHGWITCLGSRDIQVGYCSGNAPNYTAKPACNPSHFRSACCTWQCAGSAFIPTVPTVPDIPAQRSALQTSQLCWPSLTQAQIQLFFRLMHLKVWVSALPFTGCRLEHLLQPSCVFAEWRAALSCVLPHSLGAGGTGFTSTLISRPMSAHHKVTKETHCGYWEYP